MEPFPSSEYPLRTWGNDQPETIEALANLADLHRELGNDAEADAVERDIIQVFKNCGMG